MSTPHTAAIVGTGITPFGRHDDRDLRSLTEQASRAALADAGLSPADVSMVLFGNAVDGFLHGQEMIRAEVALRHLDLPGVPMMTVENACASSSSAFHMACAAVLGGAADVVLVVGAERLSHPQKDRTALALATAVDLTEHGGLGALVGATGVPDDVQPIATPSPLMDLYAAKTRSFMERTGVTVEDLAAVSVKNRLHGSLNPNAQFRRPVDLQSVLASRMISDPLRLMMCSPVGDGAAAVVVTTTDHARRLTRRSGGSYVEVKATALTSNAANDAARQPVTRAAQAAYERAGVGPEDLHVVEVHDACAAAELWLYEDLGLTDDPADLVCSQATSLGGKLPTNTGGGLIARGHPLGATGCAQLVELADQLRDRAGDRQTPHPVHALAQNSGGILDDLDEAVAAVTILSRGSS